MLPRVKYSYKTFDNNGECLFRCIPILKMYSKLHGKWIITTVFIKSNYIYIL